MKQMKIEDNVNIPYTLQKKKKKQRKKRKKNFVKVHVDLQPSNLSIIVLT